jgi:ABC-type molybdate transport system permease subunit
MFGIRIVGEFGATIAVPVVLLALAGRWLDERFGAQPAFTMAGFALAAIISSVSIYRKAKRYGREFETMTKKK